MYGINHNIWCAMAGNLVAVESCLRVTHREFRKKLNGGYKTITVWDVAKNLHTNLKKVRGFSLDVIYVSFLVAGYDAEVPRLYEVNRGCCQPRQYACIGSGASFAQEYMTEVLVLHTF
ncbi:uncharacterized protein LOC113342972, partial [Papaver somniferum]